jgi:hypothetical membrane protein
VTAERLAIRGGVVGPLAFVGAWAVGGAVTEGYSPREDAISELAAVGARTRPLMTAGFLLFGAGMVVFSFALRRAFGRPAAVAALAAGCCTIAVAAVPLDAGHDGLHGALAGAGYAALVAVPGSAAWSPGRRLPTTGLAAAATAVVAGACLVASVVVAGPDGLLQRLGLTLVDAWLAVIALGLLRRRPRTVTARA